MAFSGFCVGGVGWPRPEMDGAADPDRRRSALERAAANEAAMTQKEGGNLIRAFYSVKEQFEGVVSPRDLDLAFGIAGPGSGQAIYRRSLEERVEAVEHVAAALDTALEIVDDPSALDRRLGGSDLDAYVAGVERFNAEEHGRGVGLLLALVAPTPRWIIEAPVASTLRAMGSCESFDSLWQRYLRVHVSFHRAMVAQYVTRHRASLGDSVVVALEIGNEPDYLWIPEEMKIETALDGYINPLGKYVTELHLAQVPEVEAGAPAYEVRGPLLRPQDGEWSTTRTPRTTPVLEFEWGDKFDWYVKCFADFHQAVTGAIRREADDRGADVAIVSGSVTHNNADYLIRMHRANPDTFKSVSGIGIHPYHWPCNDVWDTTFVGPKQGNREWISASPREYATAHFKRFDFLEQLGEMLGGGNEQSRPHELEPFARAVAGRTLWITEFGFGTKVLGEHNSKVAEHTRFIRPRGQVGASAGNPTAIWEDLWEAYLDQVDDRYLRLHGVECLLLYGLRELGTPGFDMDDDDRSNLTLLRNDGSPRIDPSTLEGVRGLLGAMSGRGGGSRRTARPSAHLHRRPWRDVNLPADVSGVMTMLSEEERQLLFWLSSQYYTGAGAIVDGGCFVGGSTLALAEGLVANGGRDLSSQVNVFDLFEVEGYMADLYFPDGPRPGESFRPLFDKNTAPVRDLLRVHEGDLAELGWSGDPIEVLFVDIAKSWSLNEVVVREFLPCLIPERSVVVQQDFVFGLCPWVAITMEHLADHFEPVAFVEHNSVVYLCREPIPRDVEPVPLDHLGLDTKLALLDRAIVRFKGYPRGILESAKATILSQEGDRAGAGSILDRINAEYGDDPQVRDALSLQTRLIAASG